MIGKKLLENKSSYTIEDFAIDIAQEIQRLNAQIDLFWEKEYSLYRDLGLTDGMAVLDCGCGPAHLITRLHNEYPSSIFTGIEFSETLCRVANAQIKAKNLTRCSVFQQSITALEFPSGSFDFVISRLVIEHLSDPLLALGEVYRVLKVGGRAVFVDNDFDFHVQTFPNVPELADLYSAYCDARIHDGGNPRIGRQLPNLLIQVGYSNVSVDMICAHNRLIGDEAFSRSEGSGIALQLVKDGFLQSETYDRLAVNWGKMLKNPDHSIIRMLFVGSGIKRHEMQTSGAIALSEVTSQKTSVPIGVAAEHQHHSGETAILAVCRGVVAEAYDLLPDQIRSEHSLSSLGVNSLAGLTIAMAIKDTWNLDFSVSRIFSFATLQELADEIQSNIAKGKSGGIPGTAAADNSSYDEGVV